jgi:RNA polymerase primary sigma factor
MKPFFKEQRLTSGSMTFKQYLVEISRIPLLNENEEFEYAIKAKNGDKDAFRILVESNLRFVVSVAKQSVDKSSTIEDLVNEGNIGLIIAIGKYEPTRGLKLISYAVWWIRQKINEYKNQNSRTIRLPGNKIAQLNKVKGVINSLEQQYNRQPTNMEIAEFMDIEIGDVNELIQLELNSINSLDKPIDEDGCSLLDVIPSKDNFLSDSILLIDDKEFIITELLAKLDDRARRIIELSYGFSENKAMTLQEIGEMLDISREGVRLIRDKSLVKLKKIMGKSTMDFNDILTIGR